MGATIAERRYSDNEKRKEIMKPRTYIIAHQDRLLSTTCNCNRVLACCESGEIVAFDDNGGMVEIIMYPDTMACDLAHKISRHIDELGARATLATVEHALVALGYYDETVR